MKVKNIFVLLMLIIGLIGTNPMNAKNQENKKLDKDTLGKIIIRVVDVNSLVSVNEVFRVNFFNSLKGAYPLDSRVLEWYEKTDNKGYVVTKLKPGLYYMQFLPESSESKYEFDPSPLLSEKNRQIVAVESQKTTEVVKKVNYGGKIKIILIDPNGNKLNPREYFSADIRIKTTIASEEGLIGTLGFDTMTDLQLTGATDDLNDGEVTFGRLYPGKYEISINFGTIGYKYREIKDIEVFRNQTTTKKVIVDINDSTGIEGYITDQTGKLVTKVYVSIGSTRSKVNENGYYRIVGLDEGSQSIRIYSPSYEDAGIFENQSSEEAEIFVEERFNVTIIKNKIVRKDFTVKID